MPDNRSITETLAALSQSMAEMAAHNKAYRAKQAEENARRDARMDKMMEMWERMYGKLEIEGRADEKPVETPASTQNAPPLLSTPTLLGANFTPAGPQPLMMYEGGGRTGDGFHLSPVKAEGSNEDDQVSHDLVLFSDSALPRVMTTPRAVTPYSIVDEPYMYGKLPTKVFLVDFALDLGLQKSEVVEEIDGYKFVVPAGVHNRSVNFCTQGVCQKVHETSLLHFETLGDLMEGYDILWSLRAAPLILTWLNKPPRPPETSGNVISYIVHLVYDNGGLKILLRPSSNTMDMLHGAEEFLVIWRHKPPTLPPENVLKNERLRPLLRRFLGWKLYSLAVLGDFRLDSKKLLKTCDEVSPIKLIDSQSIVFYKPSNNSDLSFSEEDHSSVLQISGDLPLIVVGKIEAGRRSITYGLVPTWPDGITKGRMKEELKQFEELCEVKYRFGDYVNRVVIFDRVVGSAYSLVIGECGCIANMDDIVKAHPLRDSNMDGYMSRKKTMKVNPTILALEELRKSGGADINDKSVKNLVVQTMCWPFAMVDARFLKPPAKPPDDVVLRDVSYCESSKVSHSYFLWVNMVPYFLWMNERVRRACANSCADLLYGFLDTSSKNGSQYWLLWRFEGEDTRADLMQSKEFPYNVETVILGEVQDLPKGIERENKIIQTIMRQLLFALDGLHSTGIVLRDIMSRTIIFSEGTRTFKIIDLGAVVFGAFLARYINKFFQFSLPRPPEIATLRTRLILRGEECYVLNINKGEMIQLAQEGTWAMTNEKVAWRASVVTSLYWIYKQ